jgi:plastocyanin
VGGSGKYRFNPDELTFSVGDELTLVLTSETEFHTFTVKDLDIDVAVDAGKSESLTFKFDTPGTYELICIPHQSLGMRGAITVE